MGADLRGELECGDSSSSFSGSLRTYLSGLQTGEINRGRFGTEDLLIVTDFLSEEDRLDLQNRIQTVEFSLSENEGITVSDTLLFPELPSGSWDIMRSIIRAVPGLPNSKVSVGSTWEREHQIPLKTKHGDAMGELYQLFRLDSLISSGESKLAHLSWFFSYRVSPGEICSILGRETLSGTGTGYALIDIDNRALVKSNADFEIAHYDNCRVEIIETVHLELIN